MRISKFCAVRNGEKLILLAVLLVVGLQGFSQIGGNFLPLQYSVHTYSIVMDDEAYEAVWGIYPYGTTEAQIMADHTSTALVAGVAYSNLNIDPAKTGGRAYFKVQFNGNMAVYNGSEAPSPEDHVGEYVIGYLETTIDGNACATAVVKPITLYSPFDVDIALGASEDPAKCADDADASLIYHLPKDTVFQTTVVYQVTVEYPDASVGGYVRDDEWTFDYQIIVDGEGSGTNGTIESIKVEGITTTLNPTIPSGSSSFTGTCLVEPSQATPLIFTVVYNDVLGVTQNIQLIISNILGSFSEPDIDEVNGTQNNNNVVSNTIYAMPDVGYIEEWN